MKIAIIGAGAVGVTTAHALSLAGFEVDVFEQGSSAAQGASFAHSGVLGQNSVQPFFNAQFTKRWLRSWFFGARTCHWSKSTHINQYVLAIKAAWLSRRRVRQMTQTQLSDLAQYSTQVAHHYQSGEGMAFEQSSGLLVLHTSASKFSQASQQAVALNADIAVTEKKVRVFTPEQAQDYEPALAMPKHLLGAIYYPEEMYGNCALFTKQLKLLHQKSGVRYFFSQQVTRLEATGKQWCVHSHEKQGRLENDDPADFLQTSNVNQTQYDAVVVTAGAGSMSLLSSLGLKFPVLMTQAYSVTLPIKEPLDAPSKSALDAVRGTYITPIGQRIRVSGEHHVAGNASPDSQAYKILGQAIQHWYPYASKVSEASYELSTTCIAIDSKPIVGESTLKGLYMNFAHGPQHWALSFGCAHALADKLLNVNNAFDLTPFSPQRFTH
jgi:D-amino-acid dehydrogenase